ncbi:hypothetical protein R1flu_022057 [Riccia fluitans]|uniref:Uncharacterized protein n=1 Tax=Riccia fluitans TaxID=41844 RepID=A0ABD1ZU80_9MARC
MPPFGNTDKEQSLDLVVHLHHEELSAALLLCKDSLCLSRSDGQILLLLLIIISRFSSPVSNWPFDGSLRARARSRAPDIRW